MLIFAAVAACTIDLQEVERHGVTVDTTVTASTTLSAELRFRRGATVMGTRTIHAADCGALAGAAALITSMVMERVEPLRKRPPPIRPVETVAGGAAPSPPVRSARWSAAVHGGSALGLTSNAGGAARLQVELDLDPLALRLGASAARSRTATADATLWSGRLDLCPVRLSGVRVDATLCGTVAVGRFVGRGRSVRDPTTASSWWVAPGAAVRGRWWIFDRFFLEAEVAAAAAAVRPRLLLDPETVLYTSIGVGSATLGVGFSFL